MLAAILIWSSTFAASPNPIDLPPDRALLAAELVPPVPPWPEGLPDGTTLANGDSLVPKALGDATEERLRLLVEYPELCRTAVMGMARVDHVDYLGRLAVQWAQSNQVADARVANAEAHRFTFGKALVSGTVGAALTAGLIIFFEARKKN